MQKENDIQAIERLGRAFRQITDGINQVIVGQDEVVEQLLMSIFSGGHCLIVGVPGLAKTLMVHTLADSLSLDFNRIQFTPDLMPSDITGTEVIQEDKQSGSRELRFIHGPVFANVILADEINRTPPKTQAALLEAMQEHQVTVGGTRHRLDEPFFVLATQNPIEQEGTYPLPEAQLDRFMFSILVDYPDEDEELEIVRRTTASARVQLEPLLSREEILSLQETVRRVPVAEHVMRYATRLVRATRRQKAEAPDFVIDYVSWGAGPRASQYLVVAAKARAALHGRYHADCDDVAAVALPVLRHRVLTNFTAEADGVGPDDVIRRLVESISTDPDKNAKHGRLSELLGPADAG
ncbi:MAG: MoxR family ATPase [Pirellulales bacterium]